MKPDTQMQQDVLTELNWDPLVNASNIGVEVKDSIVTLAGHVSSRAEKRGAERAAQRVPGIKALVVEMDVLTMGASGQNKRTDSEIAKTAENVLSWMAVLPKNSVKVMVEEGWITLTGQVEWLYQKKAAEGAVRYLLDVTGVRDHITLSSKVSRNESAIETEGLPAIVSP